jgi:hypothetical protein
VNAWGQQVLASWNRDHRLTLTTRPCADEDHEKRKKEGTSQCFNRSGQDGAHFSSPLASVAFAESLQTQTRTGFTVEKYNGNLIEQNPSPFPLWLLFLQVSVARPPASP